MSKDDHRIAEALKWAETQTEDISDTKAISALSFDMTSNGQHNSYVIYNALKLLRTDSLCSRGTTCDGNGLELWRRLHCEWQGASAGITAAKLAQYMAPRRCTNRDDLWERLPAWERLASELELAGHSVSNEMKGVSLDALVPGDMKKTIDERVELETFLDKMKYVKAQMYHAKTNKLKSYWTGKGPKDDPMGLGNVNPGEPEAPQSPIEQILSKLALGQETMLNFIKWGQEGKRMGQRQWGERLGQPEGGQTRQRDPEQRRRKGKRW